MEVQRWETPESLGAVVARGVGPAAFQGNGRTTRRPSYALPEVAFSFVVWL